jgi:hypothetical protein
MLLLQARGHGMRKRNDDDACVAVPKAAADACKRLLDRSKARDTLLLFYRKPSSARWTAPSPVFLFPLLRLKSSSAVTLGKSQQGLNPNARSLFFLRRQCKKPLTPARAQHSTAQHSTALLVLCVSRVSYALCNVHCHCNHCGIAGAVVWPFFSWHRVSLRTKGEMIF